MSDSIKEKWLVVHPESMLAALEAVAEGNSPQDVMFYILDLAEESMQEDEE